MMSGNIVQPTWVKDRHTERADPKLEQHFLRPSDEPFDRTWDLGIVKVISSGEIAEIIGQTKHTLLQTVGQAK